jgi:hypothetical protein
MQSALSMRGVIRWWRRLARTEAAPNPTFAKLCSASVSDSGRYWREGGDTSCCQASNFSFSTLLV